MSKSGLLLLSFALVAILMAYLIPKSSDIFIVIEGGIFCVMIWGIIMTLLRIKK